jgi:hypothetical protein
MLDQTKLLNSIDQWKWESLEYWKSLHKISTKMVCLEIRVRVLEQGPFDNKWSILSIR